MFKASTNRSAVVKVVCILAMVLVCAMGVVQAMHTHPDDSTASHHVCPVCSTAHASLSTKTAVVAPILVATALAVPAPERDRTFRASAVHFIRPPPAF